MSTPEANATDNKTTVSSEDKGVKTEKEVKVARTIDGQQLHCSVLLATTNSWLVANTVGELYYCCFYDCYHSYLLLPSYSGFCLIPRIHFVLLLGLVLLLPLLLPLLCA